MNEKPNNPPAFPKLVSLSTNGRNGYEAEMQSGMSLRDYFAAKALNGILAGIDMLATDGSELKRLTEKMGYKHAQYWIAATSYQIADAMLAEREKGQQ